MLEFLLDHSLCWAAVSYSVSWMFVFVACQRLFLCFLLK